MIHSTDDKKEFAQLLKDEGDTDALEFLRAVGKEFAGGSVPDDWTICYLRMRDGNTSDEKSR